MLQLLVLLLLHGRLPPWLLLYSVLRWRPRWETDRGGRPPRLPLLPTPFLSEESDAHGPRSATMYEVVMTLLERIRANSTVNPEEALITSRILRKMSAFGMCQPLVRAYCAEAVTDAYITLKRFAEAGIEIDVMQELLEEAREDAQEDGRRVGTDPVAIFIEKSIVGHREQLRQAEQQGDSVLSGSSLGSSFPHVPLAHARFLPFSPVWRWRDRLRHADRLGRRWLRACL